MEIKVERTFLGSDYTVGKMYIDGEYFSDTLEDTVRDLTKEKKVYGKTAIPAGRYEVILNYSPKFKKELPRLLNVPHFDGILIHCLHPDMEILTENGWQNMDSFIKTPALNCYSYNMESNQIELVPIDEFIHNKYDGPMCCNKGKRVNYAVTDKHKMLVGNALHNGNIKYSLKEACSLLKENYFITSGTKNGEDITSSQRLLYRLIMAVQADGYILNWSSSSSQVRFHFNKVRKIDRVISILDELGASYKSFIDCEKKTHICLSSDISNYIAEVMNPNKYLFNYKELPIELLNLSSSVLKELLMEYLFFDGRWENYLKNSKSMIITSVNTNTLNMLQAMATLSGMRSYIKSGKGTFDLVLYEDQEVVVPSNDTYTTMDYHGSVWCVRNRNHTLVVRMNNRPMIIGNCGVTPEHTEGCILIGENKVKGQVLNGRYYQQVLVDRFAKERQEGKKSYITITNG